MRRRRLVIAGISEGVGASYKDSFSPKGTQSFEALNLLEKAAPKASEAKGH